MCEYVYRFIPEKNEKYFEMHLILLLFLLFPIVLSEVWGFNSFPMHDFFNIDRGALLYEKTLFERLCKSGYKDVYST